MTTIAYRSGRLAGDTLVTCDDQILGYAPKVFNVGGVLFGFTGALSLGQRFGKWVREGMKGDPPSLREDGESAQAYIFPGDDVVLSYAQDLPPSFVRAPFFAWGSGGQFAIGSMQRGATPEQAVRDAMVWDRLTGGDVVTVSL